MILIDPGFNTFDYDNYATKERLVEIMNKLLEQGGIDLKEMAGNISEQMFRANQLIRYYKPKPYRGNLTLFKLESISQFERNYGEPFNGLDMYCSGKITLGQIPGNHFTMMGSSIDALGKAIFENIVFE